MSDQNEQLFIDAVKAKRQAMWRVAFHLLRSEADAEDAVSAAVESTWKHLPRIRTKGALPAEEDDAHRTAGECSAGA